MDKRIAVVTITKAEETEGIMSALRAYGIECAEITFRHTVRGGSDRPCMRKISGYEDRCRNGAQRRTM